MQKEERIKKKKKKKNEEKKKEKEEEEKKKKEEEEEEEEEELNKSCRWYQWRFFYPFLFLFCAFNSFDLLHCDISELHSTLAKNKKNIRMPFFIF